MAPDVACGAAGGAARREPAVDHGDAEARARGEAGGARAGDAGADDDEVDGLRHDSLSYEGWMRVANRMPKPSGSATVKSRRP